MSRMISGRLIIRLIFITVFALATSSVGVSQPALGASHVVFSMEDKTGDDFGGGQISYPQHEVFEPGLFDLEKVCIWYDEENTYYDISFAKVTNPWNAPEGFFHQLIDIYIDAEPGGHTSTAAPGAGVAFPWDAAWEYRLRIQPWGGSRWLDARSESGVVHGIEVSVLPDERTIRAQVPFEVAPPPERVWQYYVLVGGFDAFGPDQYRIVEENPTKWSFGGATGENYPNVIDLLDGGVDKKSQKNQLNTNGLGHGELPTLLPVSHGLSLPFTWGHLLASLVVLVVLGGMFFTVWRQRSPGLKK